MKIRMICCLFAMVFAVAGCEEFSGSKKPAAGGNASAPPPPASVSNHDGDEEIVIENKDEIVLYEGDEAERRSAENLRRIGDAGLQFLMRPENQEKELLTAVLDASGRPVLSWRVMLLPQLGYQELYDKFRLDEPWDSPHNKPLLAEIPDVYRAPHRADYRTPYVVPMGPDTLALSQSSSLAEDSPEMRRIIAKISQIPAFVEVEDEYAVPWTKPEDLRYIPAAPRDGLENVREAGFLAFMLDGQVRCIPADWTDEQLTALFALSSPPMDMTSARSLAFSEVVAQMIQEIAAAHIRDAFAGGQPGLPGQGFPHDPNGQAPLEPASYLAQARTALDNGDENKAVGFGLAEAVVGDGSLLETVRWNAGLQRPLLAVRWGIGVGWTGPQELVQQAVGHLAVDPGRGGQQNAMASEAEQFLKSQAGEVYEPLLEGLKTRIDGGEFGQFFPILADTEPAHDPNAPAHHGGIPGGQPGGVRRQLSPGITMLGAGNFREILAAAAKEGVDAVIFFNVNYRRLRNDQTQRTVTVRVYDVQKGKELFASRGIQLTDGVGGVQVARGGQISQEDQAAAGAEKFLETIDTRMKMTELPAEITDEVALRRIKVLLSSSDWHPLVGLIEIRLYASKDLANPQRVAPLLAPMLGDRAIDFFSDDPEKRTAAVERWLPAGSGKRIGERLP